MGINLANFFLRRYKKADYVIKQKSKLILAISFIIIIFLIILIVAQNVRNNATVEVISPLASGLLFMGVALFLLKSGRFSLSAHLVLCICLASAWASIFFEIAPENIIVLDTIVYVVGLQVLTPVVISRYRISIMIYCVINLIVFALFCARAKDLYHLSLFSMTDYLIDNSIAMIFISIISYQMFSIYDGALRLAGEELEKNRELAQNLEEMVHDRTEELQEANDKLKEMDRIKSNFFANISHEIRTPLAMILAPVESALQGDQGVAIDRSLLVTVERNAARLLSLVNNLLDLARLDAGRMPMMVKEQDIVAFTRSYIESVSSAFETRRLELKVKSSRDVIMLYFDAEKMDRVFMNLFSNSFKYTEPGGSITITLTDDDRTCFIEFEDTGLGIPQDDLDIIFDRFGQAHAGRHLRNEGTGIGLSLVRELIQLHGGTISVESVYAGDDPVGHGTAFTIVLPKGRRKLELTPGVQFVEPGGENDRELSRQRAANIRFMTEAQDAPAEPPTAPAPAGAEASLLIVEDNADMRKYLTTLLGRFYAIRFAQNGREGLAAAEELKPDLIISDVMMPVMDGNEMARRIRDDDSLKHIPLIMLSARVESGEMNGGLPDIADEYLTKPFNSQELLARIRALLAGR